MSYTKPKCECGNDLIYSEERVVIRFTKIKADGHLRKRYDESPSTHYGTIEKLICTNKECCNMYEADLDESGRVLRGDYF